MKAYSHLISRIACLAILALLLPASAFAQGEETSEKASCYSITVDPDGVIQAQTGQTRLLRIALHVPDFGCYDNVSATLTYEDPTQGINVGEYFDFYYNTFVAIGTSALQESSFVAVLKVTDRAFPFGTRATLRKTINIHVSNGQVLLPDLRTTFIEAPGTAEAGESFTVKGTVRNDGDSQASGTFYNRLELDGIRQGSDRSCSNLNVNSTCRPQWTISSSNVGIRTLRVCADNRQDVEEENENNNCRTQSIQITPASRPDLEIESIFVSPQSPTEGHPATITVRTRNTGTASSSSFNVRLSAPGYSDDEPCGGLSVNGYCDTTFTWTPSDPGTVTISATADPQNYVQELSESNNGESEPVTVLELIPDLYFYVSGVTMSPSAPSVGDTITFTFQMHNSGEAVYQPAPEMRIEGSEISTPTTFTCSEGIANSQNCERTLTITASSAGAQWVTAKADPDFEIAESSETNNNRTLHYYVDGGGSSVTCQGTWYLTGINGTTFNTSSQGSVVDNCSVYFGQNTPTGCWETVGSDGLVADWYVPAGAGCPTTVQTTNPATGETWDFSISIQ